MFYPVVFGLVKKRPRIICLNECDRYFACTFGGKGKRIIFRKVRYTS